MAKRRRIEPHEFSWQMAFWAERHVAHPPQVMRSGCSTPPIRLWVCDWASAKGSPCQNTAHTLGLTPPTCYGGYASPLPDERYSSHTS